jgi:hypothetical protein
MRLSDNVNQFPGPRAPSLLRRFVAHWDGKRNGRRMPAFADIDPSEIPWALAHLYVLRASSTGDFIYRLAGSKVEEPYGRSLKGARISDLYPAASAAMIQQRWQRIVAEPAGCYTNTEHPSPNETFIAAHRVVLPLGEDGHSADHVIGIAEFGRMQLDDTPMTGGAVIREVSWLSLAESVRP